MTQPAPAPSPSGDRQAHGATQDALARHRAALKERFPLPPEVLGPLPAPPPARKRLKAGATAAAVLAVGWPAGAQLLIRFCGPEVCWVLRVAHWAAGVPGAGVPVPKGAAGLLLVGCVTVLILVLWRWRWCRLPLTAMAAAVACCWLAWVLSTVVAYPAVMRP